MDLFGKIGNDVYLHQGSAFSLDHDTVTFSSQNFLQNHFLLRVTIEKDMSYKEDMSYEFT